MNLVKAESPTNQTTENLLLVIQELVAEVHPQRPSTQVIGLDSQFEKDLGLDSLTRVELIARVERVFELALPERSFAETETARDLLRALQGAGAPRAALTDAEIMAVPLGRAEAAPAAAKTLLEVLDWHVEQHPDRSHIQLCQDEGEGENLNYRQLKTGAAKVAAGLQQAGLQPAEPVAIMLPGGTDYFYSFFGILMAGGIPVPVYPPARPSQLEDHMLRHARLLANCLAITLITVPEAKKVARLLKAHVPGLKHIVTVSELMTSSVLATPPTLNSNDIAFLQYTSGSTGNPKGVVLTHANLLANIRVMGQAIKVSSEDVFVSWLPLYHDMGLIGAWLGSLYYAMLLVVMPPLSFLARPERWLWTIHRYRGTLSASPNFGYEYCLKHLKDEDLQGLDLSCWRIAFNGAEPISPDTLQQFESCFANYRFPARSMMPVYGLAESSVALAFPPLNRGPVIDQIERTTFMRSGRAKPQPDSGQHALRFVSSGSPLPGHQIRIVDTAGHELPERREGRLEFRGPSTTSGYYRDADNTRKLFHQDWLDSGDLAYIANGEIYITGRIKDIIIRAGRNIYPHELEEAVGNIPGIRTGRVAVFGSMDTRTATERLIVLAETRSKDALEREQLRTGINTLAIDLAGAPPDEVVLAPPGTVLKTSSGKIRRAASSELFEKGEIGKHQRSLPWQVTRLALAGVLPQVRRVLNVLSATAYAVYCRLVFAALAPVAWLSVTLLPGHSLRWSVMRSCIRLLAKVTATPVRVNGLENLPADGSACVLVANHASYLDSYALVAGLPGTFRFVGKTELAKTFISRKPLENIHTEFVERFDISKSVSDSRHLSDVLQAGHTLMFFAEGTFTRIPGLMPFRLGAFTVAAEAGVPVIPVAIRGTRSILRDDNWLPRHGSIHIDIGPAIHPRDIEKQAGKDGWKVAIALRERCRKFILRHCGEPDLA
ncbi:MAG: AMP-binding protein [Gammaproteobacteria bacterium]|nr:MAG: AMP-binding protein [Gammaproteobacteria bacterium]